MFSTANRKSLATALAGAALASAMFVSGASAWSPDAVDAAGDPPEVAPPPSSIAASAAEEYNKLRAPDATDEIPPQQGSYPVGEYYEDLRASESQPVADEPSEPSGFDWVSAAIGAVVAAGLTLVLMATVGTRLPLRRRTETA
jgi:hypothetical protein